MRFLQDMEISHDMENFHHMENFLDMEIILDMEVKIMHYIVKTSSEGNNCVMGNINYTLTYFINSC